MKTGKKRGRKPKNSVQEVPTINNLEKKIDNNLVIRIKLNDDELTPDILPGYCKDHYCYNDCSSQDNMLMKKCWNCSHNIETTIKSIPLAYELDIFYIYGYFCCDGCCLRYITDNFSNYDLWSKYELFQFYNREIYGKNIDITIPPSKYALKEFGGNLKIEEYRKNNDYKELNMPIIIPVKNYYQNKITSNFKENGDLKLFRNSKKDKTIISNMNISQ
tara:strand:+ start:81 stop:734 length:654 start_codon:yes stop_codon:yes gene_type:complete